MNYPEAAFKYKIMIVRVCRKSASRHGYVVNVRHWIIMKTIFDSHGYNRFIFALSVPVIINSESVHR